MKNKLIYEILCLTLVILFSVIYFNNYYFSIIALVYALLKIKPGSKNSIIIFSIFLAIFTDIHIFNINQHTKYLFNFNETINFKQVTFLTQIMAKSVSILIYAFILFIFIKLNRYFRWYLAFPFTFMYLYLFSRNIHQMSETTYLISSAFLLIITKNIYYLSLNSRAGNTLNQELNLINYIQPFWFNLNEVNYYPPHSNKDLLKSDKNNKELSIIVSSIFCYVILICYFSIVYSIKTNSFQLITDIFYLNNISFNTIRSWKTQPAIFLNLEIFHLGLSFILNTFFIGPRILISFANLLGIKTKDYIDSPWRSQSFNEFFTRTMVYYNMIINVNFYYPLLDAFSFLPKNLRKYISLNMALIGGGFIIHFFKDSFRLFTISFSDFLAFELSNTLPYLTILALIITLSQLTSGKNETKGHQNHWFKFLLFVYIYSLTLPFTMSKYIGNFNDVLLFYKKIFFI